MLKYIIAAAVAFAPTAANAQNIVINLDRSTLIKEAAKTICRAAMERKGSAVEILKRESAYLDLTQDERLYLLSLCILYAQGRNDAQ